ncbi:pilus assembly FimT family protein [Psychrobacter sp. ASPA161_6]|uniref:pilus assembly FimT family protein n=1 Tax=Psychrobacter sp. ASPA161_6 TaxID=3160962 RepID=UPI003F80C726
MNASAKNLPHPLRMTSSGFTLIELLVTIAVLAIIVSIAAPSISTQLANQRVKSTASTLENALKEAKAESIVRRQDIDVIYNSASNPKTIILQNDGDILSTYNISDQNTVTIATINTPPTAITTVTFQPNKVIAGDDDILYSICDSGSTNETPRQIRLNKIANINTTNTGSC